MTYRYKLILTTIFQSKVFISIPQQRIIRNRIKIRIITILRTQCPNRLPKPLVQRRYGIGRIQCFIPVIVNVVSKEEYGEWITAKQSEATEVKQLTSQDFTLDELMVRGESVYDTSCLACHGGKGEGGVGNAIAGSAVATGDINAHLEIGINGVPGTSMQAFGGQLSDVDMAAVITYQRNAFGNNMGDSLQPIDVYNYKKG